MYAHGIEIFNRADDDDIVSKVTHDFEFILFPTKDGLFDQCLMDGRKIEATRENVKQFFAIVGDTASRAA